MGGFAVLDKIRSKGQGCARPNIVKKSEPYVHIRQLPVDFYLVQCNLDILNIGNSIVTTVSVFMRDKFCHVNLFSAAFTVLIILTVASCLPVSVGFVVCLLQKEKKRASRLFTSLLKVHSRNPGTESVYTVTANSVVVIIKQCTYLVAGEVKCFTALE